MLKYGSRWEAWCHGVIWFGSDFDGALKHGIKRNGRHLFVSVDTVVHRYWKLLEDRAVRRRQSVNFIARFFLKRPRYKSGLVVVPWIGAYSWLVIDALDAALGPSYAFSALNVGRPLSDVNNLNIITSICSFSYFYWR